MKIGKKIMAGYSVVIALMVAIAVISSTFLGVNDTDSDEVFEHYGTQQGNLGGWGYYFQLSCAQIRNIVFLSEDSAALEQNINAYMETRNTMATYRNELEKMIEEDSLRDLFNQIDQGISSMKDYRDRTIQYMRAGDQENAIAVMVQANSLIENISNRFTEMIAHMRELGNENLQAATNLTIISICVNVGVTVLGTILCVILGIKIGKSLSVPVAQVEHGVLSLSEGNLEVRVPSDPNRKDEIGVLVQAYNNSVDTLGEYIHTIEEAMNSLSRGDFQVQPIEGFKGEFVKIEKSINALVIALNDTFARINSAAESVASGSEQGASGAQSLSQGATEQASAVEQLDATINEISKHIQENAQNAEFASQEATALGDGIINNNQQMQDMIAAMSEISRCSDEISKIIKTIQDIAFQTNILALNAAVEAARAGAAGKGFAVVADEVRNLASKSSEAAKDTTVLIENSVKAVQNGIKIADDTANSLAEIVSKAKEVTEVINKISAASQDQAESVVQVTQGINQISSVVQTNTATAEETAASSEELSGQAQVLKRMMNQFKFQQGFVDPSHALPAADYPAADDFDMDFDSGADFSVHDKY